MSQQVLEIAVKNLASAGGSCGSDCDMSVSALKRKFEFKQGLNMYAAPTQRSERFFFS